MPTVRRDRPYRRPAQASPSDTESMAVAMRFAVYVCMRNPLKSDIGSISAVTRYRATSAPTLLHMPNARPFSTDTSAHCHLLLPKTNRRNQRVEASSVEVVRTTFAAVLATRTLSPSTCMSNPSSTARQEAPKGITRGE